MRPKVSVIVPIYNTGKYLDRCVHCLQNQTLKEIEIILVDDESPDNAPEMCDAYALSDPRIKVIHKKNGGLGLARNSGMEIAAGEFVAYLDSDDYISTDMYEKLYNRARSTDSDTCFCGCAVDRGDNRIEELPFPLGNVIFDGNSAIVDNVLLNLLGAKPDASKDNLLGMQVWRGLYSLDLIREKNITFCSERRFICEDAIFHIDYFRHAKKFSSIEDCCYYYCVYDVSLSRVYRADRFDKNIIFYLEEVRRLGEYEILDKAKPYIDRMFMAMIRGNMKDAVSHMGKKEAISCLKYMILHPEVQKVLKDYPYHKNPVQLRIFNALVAMKAVHLVYILLSALGRG